MFYTDQSYPGQLKRSGTDNFLKKDQAYFDSLKQQVLEDREKRIFSKEPTLQHKPKSVQSRVRLIRKQHMIQSQIIKQRYHNVQLGRYIRAQSCHCLECGSNTSKLYFSQKCKYYTAQERKTLILRRFRKYVRAVLLVLAYKHNYVKINAKRYKRLSLKQKALLAIHNPTTEQKIEQEKILQSQDISMTSDQRETLQNQLRQRNPHIYQQHYPSNRAINSYILSREKSAPKNEPKQELHLPKLTKQKSKSSQKLPDKLPPLSSQNTKSQNYFAPYKAKPPSRQKLGSISHQDSRRGSSKNA